MAAAREADEVAFAERAAAETQPMQEAAERAKAVTLGTEKVEAEVEDEVESEEEEK